MEKVQSHGFSNTTETPKECNFKTKEELRELYAEALGNKGLTWDEINKQVEKDLNKGELPNSQSFFNFETGEMTTYNVPKIHIPRSCK